MELERDPSFNNDDRYELTRPQVRERTMAKIRAVHHYIMNDPEHLSRMRFDLLSLVDPGLMTRMGVHVSSLNDADCAAHSYQRFF